MQRPKIDDEHRQKRKAYLEKYNLHEGPDERKLLDASVEFGEQPFSTEDLYDLYLSDYVKTLRLELAHALSIPGGVARNFVQAHAAAAAHSMMLLYLMMKSDAS
jgi:hypothetical protein